MCSTPLPVWLSRRKNKRLAIARAPVDLWLLASLSSLMDCEAHGWARQPQINFDPFTAVPLPAPRRTGERNHTRAAYFSVIYWRTLRVKYHDGPIWISLLVSGAGVTLVTPLGVGKPSRLGMRPTMCPRCVIVTLMSHITHIENMKRLKFATTSGALRETKQTSATQTGALKRPVSHGACEGQAKWMVTSSFAAWADYQSAPPP